MEIETSPPCRLTYCLNVHPGESWEENLSAIREHTLSIKAKVCPGAPFGLGLRLSARAAEELSRPGTLASFRSFLAAHDLYVFTVNAFPFGCFHGERVKERVYAPDWKSPERLAYTRSVAEILGRLDLPGGFASISTVPGSYLGWVKTSADEAAMAENLVRAAIFLAGLERDTGRRIGLALEPEPDCFLENAAELAEFFCGVLLPLGAPLAAAALSCTPEEARGILSRHLGACLDTCHAAVCHQDLEESVRTLAASGVPLQKVQISAAPIFSGRIDPARVRALADPVYLHQARLCLGAEVLRFPDIEDAAAFIEKESPAAGELRVHCHLPLFFRGDGGMSSTASLLGPGFFTLCREAGCRHFEVETYTFSALAPEFRQKPLTESIVSELRMARELVLG